MSRAPVLERRTGASGGSRRPLRHVAVGEGVESGRAKLAGPRVALQRIWDADPYLIEIEAARASADPVVSSLGRELEDDMRVIDLRTVEVGSGFAWGRAGPNARNRRCGAELVFGVEGPRRRSLLRRPPWEAERIGWPDGGS